MIAPVHRIDGRGADACAGTVRLDPAKVLWNGTMLAGTIAAPFFASWASVALFSILLYATLLLGHSVGMHRMMIHRAADARPWLFRSLLLLGTWVGIGGPAQVVRTHDERDWAQRQAQCHAFFAHTARYPKDLFWQLFCRFDYSRPPTLTLEPELAHDPVVAHLSRHWRAHQLALAALLFAWGGLPFVLWGVCVRVLVSAVGHWSVTYVCHNPGPGRYHVHGAGVQASDLAGTGRVRAWLAGMLTHGEAWHSNHHAFPESARIGLEAGQVDPAAWVIEGLARLGWVTRVGGPREVAAWDDLVERRQEKTRAGAARV